MRFQNICRLLAVTLLLGLSSFGVPAHEGHDHDAAPPKITVPAAPRGEASSELFELVAIARNAELIIYLDRFLSNEPISDAAIAVETPNGSVEAKPAADGSYRIPAPWTTAGGRYDLIFTVTYKDDVDILALTLEVPASFGSQTPASGSGLVGSAIAQGIKDRVSATNPNIAIGIFIAFLAGTVVGLWLARRKKTAAALVVFVALGIPLARSSIAHEGEDHGSPAVAVAPGTRDIAQRMPEGDVFLPKPVQRIFALRSIMSERATHQRSMELPGRIIPDPNASGYVQAAIGGRLSPPTGGFPRLGTPVKQGDILAYVTPPLQAIDVSTMRQQQGDLDQQISIVERRVARYENLAPSGAVARVQLDEARLELQGLKDRRAALDKVRREPEALIAPVSGIVADGTPVAGQIAQPNAVIFHIVDPGALWVEALSFEALPGGEDANALTASGKRLPLAPRGAGFADRNQSVPVHFAIESDLSGLRVGQFVTVLVATDDRREGIAIPRSALVRAANGQDFIYEHVGAERFAPRPVRVEPLDGERVLVVAGLEPGKRVVSQGAELLDHVR